MNINKTNYIEAMQAIQRLGFAVVVFTDAEMDSNDIDADSLEEFLIEKGNEYIIS